MFKQAFEFWAANHKNIYSLFVVEEKLTLLKQYLSSFKKLDKPSTDPISQAGLKLKEDYKSVKLILRISFIFLEFEHKVFLEGN